MTDTAYRTVFLDNDTRRQPKTKRFCVRCQKDLKPGSNVRSVHLVDNGPFALHPEDEGKPVAKDGGWWLLGPECVSKIGIEWTHEEREISW